MLNNDAAMKKPLVSVIIPVYNRPAQVRKAIDSVRGQTCKDSELIVVDDGSTDETGRVLEEYRNSVHVLTTAHAGPSAARNRGIEHARARHLAFLDSDDLWLPRKLEIQMRYFHEHPEVRICQTEEIWLRSGVRVNPMKKHKKYSGRIFEKCLPLCIVSPSAVMIHREVFERVGLFDESMPACEDYDLWLRIAAHYPIMLIDEPLIVKHGGHSDQQSRTVPHLDRYRIQALCKCLASGAITAPQYDSALAELARKCRIYGQGCLKRGRHEEGEAILRLPETFKASGRAGTI